MIGATDVYLESWDDTVSVFLATDPEETSFAKVLELDANGNAKAQGHLVAQAEIQ